MEENFEDETLDFIDENEGRRPSCQVCILDRGGILAILDSSGDCVNGRLDLSDLKARKPVMWKYAMVWD